MDYKSEIEGDAEALKRYIEIGYPIPNVERAVKFLRFAEDFKNSLNGNAPEIKVNMEKGIIEYSKSLFDTNSIEHHKRVVNQHPFMTYHELLHITQHINKARIKNNEIHEWIKYAEDEIVGFKKSEDILIKAGVIVKRDGIFIPHLLGFRKMLIKKFWWRLGWFGIVERWKARKTKRERTIEKFIKNYNRKK